MKEESSSMDTQASTTTASPNGRLSQQPPDSQAGSASTEKSLQLHCSDNLAQWLSKERLSLGFTTANAGKPGSTFLIGHQREEDDERLSIYQTEANQGYLLCAVNKDGLYISGTHDIWCYENIVPTDNDHQGYDKLYVPQTGTTTGNIGITDIAFDDKIKQPLFSSSLFSCVATTSHTKSFEVIWKPDFITEIAPESRCYLSGLALREGELHYTTAFSQTNEKTGWQTTLATGGIVIDTRTNRIMTTNLSMPHSPLWHDNKLWLLNTGFGELGYLDETNNHQFKPVAFCPGFSRGLAFHGDVAIVGVSTLPKNGLLKNSPLERRLEKHNITPFCGLTFIDLNAKEPLHWLRLAGNCIDEVTDIVLLPEVIKPMLVGPQSKEVNYFINFDDKTEVTSPNTKAKSKTTSLKGQTPLTPAEP